LEDLRAESNKVLKWIWTQYDSACYGLIRHRIGMSTGILSMQQWGDVKRSEVKWVKIFDGTCVLSQTVVMQFTCGLLYSTSSCLIVSLLFALCLLLFVFLINCFVFLIYSFYVCFIVLLYVLCSVFLYCFSPPI
jgi:hypothetical protein